MNNKIFIITFSILSIFVGANLSLNKLHQEKNKGKVTKQKEKKLVVAPKIDTTKVIVKKEIKENDSLKIDGNLKFKLYKKQAHASYYNNKFNGRDRKSVV